ncbi:amidohydrolase family protein [Tenggerimyces flavus]|uniref:Amidohydrolase family protein n=1 Tax=Tenggerimyces flavus TaxID=1708749 RepID=A0ABV7YED6_9ACTN|nr:amidohydrolase family protein [Tenggerimyces flavus]MBM7786719.1 L-fuconolactonase [Tenggerimyces flavus]
MRPTWRIGGPIVVDAHAHVWSGDTTTFPPTPIDGVSAPKTPRPVDDLLGRLDTAHVDRVVLIQPRSYGHDHTYLAHVLASEPERVAGVCLVDPLRPDAPGELRRRCREDGYRGLRLVGLGHGDADWLFDDRTAPMWKAAEDLEIVVSLLIEPHQLAGVATVAARRPWLSIAIDHLGRCQPGTTAIADLLALAVRPNVSVKVSALSWLSAQGPPHADLRPMVESCLAEFGAGRLLWGTDYPHVLAAGPYPDPFEELAGVLPQASEAELAMIAGGNAARLYGLL